MDLLTLRDTERGLHETEVIERPWISLPFTPSSDEVSPVGSNLNMFAAPIGRKYRPQKFECAVFVIAPNSATNYWQITLNIQTPGGVTVQQGIFDTSGIAAASWNVLSLTTFATPEWDPAVYSVVFIGVAKVMLPSAMYINPALWVV